jgi:biotin transporter BioY
VYLFKVTGSTNDAKACLHAHLEAMASADGAVMENKTIKTRNRVISTLIALVVAMLIGLVVLSFFSPDPTESAKPNIIFILADDLVILYESFIIFNFVASSVHIFLTYFTS